MAVKTNYLCFFFISLHCSVRCNQLEGEGVEVIKREKNSARHIKSNYGFCTLV